MHAYKMVGLTIVMYCDCNVMATSDTVKVCNCWSPARSVQPLAHKTAQKLEWRWEHTSVEKFPRLWLDPVKPHHRQSVLNGRFPSCCPEFSHPIIPNFTENPHRHKIWYFFAKAFCFWKFWENQSKTFWVIVPVDSYQLHTLHRKQADWQFWRNAGSTDQRTRSVWT